MQFELLLFEATLSLSPSVIGRSRTASGSTWVEDMFTSSQVFLSEFFLKFSDVVLQNGCQISDCEVKESKTGHRGKGEASETPEGLISTASFSTWEPP